MVHSDALVAQRCGAQLGTATHAQLLDDGVSRHTIARLVQTGELVVLHQGVYLHVARGDDRRSRLMAAVIAGGPEAVASHRSAAVLHGLDSIRAPRPEITLPALDLPRVRGVTMHRTNLLESADVCTVGGIPTTTIPRTLLDLGAVLPFEVVESAAQDAIIRKLTTVPRVVAVLDRVGRRGRRGTAALRAIVHQSMPDERLQSELERPLHVLIRQAGMPAPVLQKEVRLRSGASVHLDFSWPDRMIAVEAQGWRWHATRAAMDRWMLRDRALRELGWDIRYYGWSDAVERRSSVIHELSALLPIAA